MLNQTNVAPRPVRNSATHSNTSVHAERIDNEFVAEHSDQITTNLWNLCFNIPALKKYLHKEISTSKAPKSSKLPDELFERTGPPRIIAYTMETKFRVTLYPTNAANLVSLQFLHDIGIKEIEASEQMFQMVAGPPSKCLGKIRNLPVEIHGVTRFVNASEFHNNSYQLLMGRHSIGDFDMSTDFATDSWEMPTPEGKIKLNISHHLEPHEPLCLFLCRELPLQQGNGSYPSQQHLLKVSTLLEKVKS
ncbi:hypothetical protein DSO57_1034623 [Entomophthora muscae]|uniref:Uncharacterized protein n=1 Tax=Entomophthora muscae TaxID=34485 RepID=A0ACC2TB11_9FUNG|nr:hypothetical protein DSO57_1034623 [Entomophthora muscae]